jgi:hypothetical protein
MTGMKNVTIEDCQIAFRNFAGNEDKFNPKGSRNFALLLTEKDAVTLTDLGWNVKYLKPRDDEPQGQAFLKVSCTFGKKPPKIIMVTSRGKTYLDEESVNSLDWVDIEQADITLNPYEWDVNGVAGVKAYVKTLIIKPVEDYLEMKWDRIIEAGLSDQKSIEAPSDYIDAEYYETHEIGA